MVRKGVMLVPRISFFFCSRWSGGVGVKRWTINLKIRGSIPDLARTFLRHFVFPTELEVSWFETQR